MQLDLHREYGSVIRLHHFDHEDLRQLDATLADLADWVRCVVPLHEEPYVEPLHGCRLTLKLSLTDEGLHRTVDPNLFGWVQMPGTWEPFVCELTPASWGHVRSAVGLLLRLRFLSSEHVWLHRQFHAERGGLAWLLSPDGEW